MTELTSCRPNLEVHDLEPTVTHLTAILGFELELLEPEMGLALLHRDTVGLAVVRTTNPAVNETTACYIGVTGVDEFYRHCGSLGATISVDLTDHPWGLRDFVVEIPGGHRLAFGERIVATGADTGGID
ncbi:VOC family protein [Nocardia sp. NPDC003482]